MASLPWDTIVNILTRLPVEDLLRYRCVSKTWCSLIDGPDFIKMHLNRSMETSSHLSLVRGHGELYSVDVDNLDSAAVLLNPPVNEGLGKDIVGHCNGLLVLTNKDGDTAIWNPATRKHIKVPTSDLKKNPGMFEFGMVGFGYDPVNDDYKLLRMIHYYLYGFAARSEVKVYSRKSNTWKRVADFPYSVIYRANGVLAANSLHWMLGIQSQSGSFEIVVAFDLVTEEYREISLPKKKILKDKSYYTTMTELGGWLCVVTKYHVDQMADLVDIWVLKESWTKLFSVVPSDVTGSFEYVMPLAYLKSVQQVLFDQGGEKLMWYDLERKGAISVKEISGPKCSLTVLYVRTLLGVGGGDGDNNGKKAGEDGDKGKEKKQQSGKKR
ncbi:F-box domain containing protein [Trema orientale]|uniref:F-box domain containing protein n=1 Tax=Trema orientale TaxID=63057 RepID=A0A2P5F0Q7_TREOI|nr:F-box domain containing protein [Trema orientale]